MDIKRVVIDPGPSAGVGTDAQQVLRIDIAQKEVYEFLCWLGKHDATEVYTYLLYARVLRALDWVPLDI